MNLKVLSVFGTRPEAIKMAPLVLALRSDSRVESKVCVTGQHRQMLDQALEVFGLSPDFDLSVMKANQGLADVSAAILTGMDALFAGFRPDVVLVHGDTTTSFLAALSAYYRQIPVAHVEAGLRTGDIFFPWPEEGNRKLISGLATLHFAPTEGARSNLLHEGVKANSIAVTGNTVVDALLLACDKIAQRPDLCLEYDQRFSFLQESDRFILVTGHRRENFGGGLERICAALIQVAASFPDVQIVYPVHLNPNVSGPVKRMLGGVANIHLIDPVDYLPFVYLMSRCYLLVTDSGGIQEEAPSLGKPVLVTRDATERPEAVDAGVVRIVGTDTNSLVSEMKLLLNSDEAYKRMAVAQNPYGDGQACARIVARLKQEFGYKNGL